MHPFDCSLAYQNFEHLPSYNDQDLRSNCIERYLIIALNRKLQSYLRQTYTITKVLFSYVFHLNQTIKHVQYPLLFRQLVITL